MPRHCWFSLLLITAAAAAGYRTPHDRSVWYVDFGQGNDLADGRSRATAWRTIPGTAGRDGKTMRNREWGKGAVSSRRKVTAGTSILLRPGTTYSAALGGEIRIDREFYEDATRSLPIRIMVDTAWGTGQVILDGSGIATAIALVIVRTDGVMIDGVRTRGLLLRNSPRGGIQVKEKQGSGSPVSEVTLRNISFINNGTGCRRGAECDDGQLNVRLARGLLVERCRFDGNGNHLMGMLLGDGGRFVTGAVVRHCSAFDHRGDDPPNDRGIGFKALNGDIVFEACSSWANLKGWDLGEQKGGGRDITYTLLNNVAFRNDWGINLNSAGSHTYSGKVRFYLINNLVYRNRIQGSNVYAGPYELYAVHNLYAFNGSSGVKGKDKGNLRITPNGPTDGTIEAYLFNNIFYKPAGPTNLTTSRYYVSSFHQFNIHSDYNAWIASGPGGVFCRWAYFDSRWTHPFEYGKNGPGRDRGGWFDWYDISPKKPSNGQRGHWGCDAHSRGTGAVDQSSPRFANERDGDFRLQSGYPGANLSGQSWFTREMGLDRNGVERKSWDMGPFEHRGR